MPLVTSIPLQFIAVFCEESQMAEIKLIDNQQDLQRVFRLRYAVYVEELGAQMEHADHQRKEVHRPFTANRVFDEWE